jgi:hypothetical protein
VVYHSEPRVRFRLVRIQLKRLAVLSGCGFQIAILFRFGSPLEMASDFDVLRLAP